MPFKDPEAARTYRKEKHARIMSDPKLLELKRENERNRYKKLAACPENRAKLAKRCASWRSNNPQKIKDLGWRANLKRHYGMTVEMYEDLLAAQNNACAICKATRGAKRQRLHVDHDHATGRIRGLLCSACNRGIGFFKDSPNLLQTAAAYLARST